MTHPTFEITKSTNGQFHFNLTARNGEKILHSELYTTKSNCEKGVESVKKNAANDERFEREEASNGQYYFNLKASNGEIIGTSQRYTSSSARDNGIASVKENASKAQVEENV